MIVNTALVIRKRKGKQIPFLLLVSDDFVKDRENLSFLRLEFFAARAKDKGPSIVVTVPDREMILCATTPLPEQVVERLEKSLAEVPEGLHLAISDMGQPPKEHEIFGFGTGRVDFSGRLAEGVTLLQAGRNAEALTLLEAVRDGGLEWPEVHNYVGQAYLALGDGDRARNAFRNAMEGDPRSVDARVGSGRLARRDGRMEIALLLFEEALQLYPNHVPALVAYGAACFDLADLSRAKRALARAVAVHPDGTGWREVCAKIAKEMKTSAAELEGKVKAMAESEDRSQAVVEHTEASSTDLTRAKIFRLVLEETFGDGALSQAEQELITNVKQLLKIDAPTHSRLFSEAEKDYRAGKIKREGELDRVDLYKRVYLSAKEDGLVNEDEKVLLDRFARYLELTDDERQGCEGA